MKKIDYTPFFIADDASVKDVLNLLGYVSNVTKLADQYIRFTSHNRADEFGTMTTITITFVAFDRETNVNSFYKWTCHRAKDHCCSNSELMQLSKTNFEAYQTH